MERNSLGSQVPLEAAIRPVVPHELQIQPTRDSQGPLVVVLDDEHSPAVLAAVGELVQEQSNGSSGIALSPVGWEDGVAHVDLPRFEPSGLRVEVHPAHNLAADHDAGGGCRLVAAGSHPTVELVVTPSDDYHYVVRTRWPKDDDPIGHRREPGHEQKYRFGSVNALRVCERDRKVAAETQGTVSAGVVWLVGLAAHLLDQRPLLPRLGVEHVRRDG